MVQGRDVVTMEVNRNFCGLSNEPLPMTFNDIELEGHLNYFKPFQNFYHVLTCPGNTYDVEFNCLIKLEGVLKVTGSNV